MKYLTDQQYDQFQSEGYIVLDSFLSPDEVRATKRNIDEVCAARAHMTKDADGFNLEKEGDNHLNQDAAAIRAGMFRKIQGAVFRVPAVRDVFTSGKMLDSMEDLMGVPINYHSSKVMFKPANGGSAKPWHQDAAYWKNFDPRQITVWLALDDATEENGCVWVIPGSHKAGLIPHVAAELQVEESKIDLSKAIPAPVKPGGLLIFHSLVLHMSKKNLSDKNRCAIICDFDCLPTPALDVPRDIVEEVRDAEGVWCLRGA